MSGTGAYNLIKRKPFNLIAFIKGLFGKETINSFYTVAYTTYRFGDYNSVREKHFKKYKDAFNYYKWLVQSYDDTKHYKSVKEVENEYGILFEVCDNTGEWKSVIELLQQKLN